MVTHEQRPFAISTYKEVEKFGAKVYMEEEFDNIVFAKDGESMTLMDLNVWQCKIVQIKISATNNWK